MANVNAELGLIITAKDEASRVFETFARAMSEAFTSVNEQSKTFKESFDAIASSSTKDTTAIEEGMSQVVKGIGQMNESLESMTKNTGKVSESLDLITKANALQQLGSALEHAGEKSTSFFEHAISEGAHFEQQVDAVAATLNSHLTPATQLTKQQYDALNEKALELGKSGFFSANQVAEGMYTLARQGIDYQSIMGGAMDSIQDLAVATDSDLTSTSNVVSDIIHEMGGELKEEFGDNLQNQFTGVGNMISGAMHNARMSMDDFLNTLKYVGPQAGAVGMSLKDVAVATSLLGEHGIRSSQAGTTLRRMLTELTPTSKNAKEMMEQLGIITKDGGNKFLDATGHVKSFAEIHDVLNGALKNLSPAQQQFALKTMFSQYALSGMSAIANTSKDELNKLTTEVTKTSNAHDLAQAKWNNSEGAMRRLKASYETLVKEIGENLLPVANRLMEWGKKLMDMFDKLSPSTKNNIITFTALGGVLMLVAGKAMSFVSNLMFLGQAFKDLLPLLGATASGTQGVGVVMAALTSPVAIAVAAIIGLIAVFVELYKHNEAFRKKVNEAWIAVKKTISSAVDDLKTILKVFIDVAMNLWKKYGDDVVKLATMAFDMMYKVVKGVLDVISGIIKVFAGILTGDWHKIWEGVKQILKGAWTTISATVEYYVKFIPQLLSTGFSVIGSIVGNVFGGSWNLIKNGFNDVVHFFDNNIKYICGLFSGAKLSFPHIPLPHFSMSGSMNPVDWVSKGLPTIGVQWFAEGGIMMNPMAFGMNGSNMMVGGEKEPEAIAPLSKLREMLGIDKERKGFGGSHTKHQVNHITINVNGAGKNGTDLANDLARQLRLQMSMVSI